MHGRPRPYKMSGNICHLKIEGDLSCAALFGSLRCPGCILDDSKDQQHNTYSISKTCEQQKTNYLFQ